MDIENFKRLFGLRVQSFRRQQHLTQEELAERIDRSVDTVSNLERGASSTRIETAFRIAEALGIGILDLFDVGPANATDRERRQMIERLNLLLSGEDVETVAAVISQAEILLRVKSRSLRMPKPLSLPGPTTR